MVTSYKEMTLQMYEHLSKIAESDTDDIEKQIQMVSVLTGKTTKEVEDLPISEYHSLAKKTVFLMREPEIEQIKSNTVKINERVYVITNDVTKITTAQYIDFQEYMKQGKNLANVLSTLLVPKGEKYGEADFLEVKKDIERLPICTALGLNAFFLQRFAKLIANTLHCSMSALKSEGEKTKAKELIQWWERLATGGAGFPLSIL